MNSEGFYNITSKGYTRNRLYIRGMSEKYPTCVYIIFFDCEGVVHYEFAPSGQTVNNKY